MASKVVVVLGASGRQGGSTAQHLLASKEFNVRAVSRDITNPKLVELQSQGAELVKASYDEPESLKAAFSGAYAVFANTNIGSAGSIEAERQQGINIAEAAAATSSVEHFLWSSALDVEGMSAGKYSNIIHFKAKAEVAKYIKEKLPQLATKTTEVFVPPYFENWQLLPGLYGPIPADGKLKLALPVVAETFWPSVPIQDIGKVTRAVLEHPEKTRGQGVSAAMEALGFKQLLEQWGEVNGTEVEYEKLTPDEFVTRNVAQYKEIFEGEATATLFVRAATEQMQFMEDIIMGKIPFQVVLQMPDIVGAEVGNKTWKQFAAEAGSKSAP